MPNVTVTPPSIIKVKVGDATNPQAIAINYGKQTTISKATDINMLGAVDGDVIVYKSASNSFIVEPIGDINISIDNGFF